MKIMLLAGLYLFFVRVLWSVYNELRDPRTAVRRQQQFAAAPARRGRRGQPAAAAVAPPAPAPDAAGGFAASVAPGAAGATMAPPIPVIGQLTVLEPRPMAGMSWALGIEITLGRVPTCGIHLDDTYVSSVHARIFSVDGTFMIEDLDSRNGTVLNGAPLAATTALRPGDVIALGATAMEFS